MDNKTPNTIAAAPANTDNLTARLIEACRRDALTWADRTAIGEAIGRIGWTSTPADPMDWPLPCAVTVGHGTMHKGVPLRTLVARMKVLYEMATGNNADEVANRTPEQLQALRDSFIAAVAKAQPTAPQQEALALLSEVSQVFTRDDDLPGDLLNRIDALLAEQPAGGAA